MEEDPLTTFSFFIGSILKDCFIIFISLVFLLNLFITLKTYDTTKITDKINEFDTTMSQQPNLTFADYKNINASLYIKSIEYVKNYVIHALDPYLSVSYIVYVLCIFLIAAAITTTSKTNVLDKFIIDFMVKFSMVIFLPITLFIFLSQIFLLFSGKTEDKSKILYTLPAYIYSFMISLFHLVFLGSICIFFSIFVGFLVYKLPKYYVPDEATKGKNKKIGKQLNPDQGKKSDALFFFTSSFFLWIFAIIMVFLGLFMCYLFGIDYLKIVTLSLFYINLSTIIQILFCENSYELQRIFLFMKIILAIIVVVLIGFTFPAIFTIFAIIVFIGMTYYIIKQHINIKNCDPEALSKIFENQKVDNV